MSKFFYPLPEEYYNKNNDTYRHGAKTYSKHGIGRLDLAAPDGTEVHSMTDGVVYSNGTDSGRSGSKYRRVIIKVESGYSRSPFYIRYYHIKGLDTLKDGDIVKQGDLIGHVGDPEVHSGSHLHVDFCKNGTSGSDACNPVLDKIPDTGGGSAGETLRLWGSQDTYSNYGYCWDVFAGEWQQLTPSDNVFSGDIPSEGNKITSRNPNGGWRVSWFSDEHLGSWRSDHSRLPVDCAIGDGKVRGSFASRDLWERYKYNYNGKRTMFYIDIPKLPAAKGYYYLDDIDGMKNVNGTISTLDFWFPQGNTAENWVDTRNDYEVDIRLVDY